MSRRTELKTILDTIAGRTMTTAQAADIAEAIASAYRPDKTPNAEQQAAITLTAIRRFIRETVHGQRVREAQEAARLNVTPPDLGQDDE